MRKIFRSFAALSILVLSGCVNNLTNEDINPAGKTTVTIGLAETKTYLGDLEEGKRKVYWSDGDKISVNGVSSSSIALSEDKRSAEFTFDAVLEYPYSILYPAEMYKDAQTITLPAVQAAANNTFAVDAAPMASYQAVAGRATLSHLAGVVRLQVKLPTDSDHGRHQLNRIEFRGKAGEQVSGDFAIDYQEVSLTGASTAEADKVVTAKVGKTLSAESTVEVFVVVPARRYEQGFSVRLIDAAGHYMDVATNDITIAKGEIKSMPALEFNPTGTLVGVEISSADDLVAFAKAYNAGEYNDIENLNVKVAADIVFDEATNAAWESIENFSGSFDGGNFSIKNWKSSVSLFFSTKTGSCIENLTIDSSCQLTAHSTGENRYFGGFVSYHQGLLYNCHNNAALTITSEWNATSNIGGLVGRMRYNAKVEKCSMAGNITADAAFNVTDAINLGGLVGHIQEAEGMIVDSQFAGDLKFEGAVSTDKACIGGIVGRSFGVVSGCSTAEGKNIIGESADKKVKCFHFGGIVGWVEGGSITDSDNNAYVKLKYLRAKGCEKIYMGGVTGYLGAASVTNCENKNNVHSYSDCNNVYIGGVIGHATANAVIDKCHNRSTAEVSTMSSESGSYGHRYLYMGGVAGDCETSNVSNISNAGLVEMNSMENNKNAQANVGGCFGYLYTVLDGKNTITNSGAVTATDGVGTRSYIALGGIVGCIYNTTGTLSNVSNSGSVTDAGTAVHTNAFTGGIVGVVRAAITIDGVTNTGDVTFSNASQQTHTNVCLGGVVAGVSALGADSYTITVKKSTNTGAVLRVATTEAINGSGMVCGGIVGILKGNGSEVDNCTNRGSVRNEGLNTTKYDADFDKSGQAAGGIVGFALGSTKAAQIKDCTNYGNCYTARGYVGGIAGNIRNTVVSGCYNRDNIIDCVAGNIRIGGITGCIADQSKITSSHVVNATIDGKNGGNTGGITGGFPDTKNVAYTALIENSTVDATVYNSVNTGRAGSIVGLSYAGLKISGCQVKGKVGAGPTLTEITSGNLLIDGNGKATVENCSLLQ